MLFLCLLVTILLYDILHFYDACNFMITMYYSLGTYYFYYLNAPSINRIVWSIILLPRQLLLLLGPLHWILYVSYLNAPSINRIISSIILLPGQQLLLLGQLHWILYVNFLYFLTYMVRFLVLFHLCFCWGLNEHCLSEKMATLSQYQKYNTKEIWWKVPYCRLYKRIFLDWF